MKTIQIILAASVCFSTTSLVAQTSAKLKLPENKKYKVVNKLETNSSTDVQGQSMESTVNVTSTYTIEVKDKSGENYNLNSTLSGINMNMSMMGQDIKFDSDNQDDMNGQFGTALKDYINKPKEIQMDQSGKVSFDEKDTSLNSLAKQLHLAQNGFGTQLAFLPFPANAKVGDSWTDSTNNDGISKTTHFTIKDINGNTATVSFTAIDSISTTMEQNGMEISTKTSGKAEGEEKVDMKTGVIQSSTYKGDASGTVNAMGQEFPMSTKITSNTTVTEL